MHMDRDFKITELSMILNYQSLTFWSSTVPGFAVADIYIYLVMLTASSETLWPMDSPRNTNNIFTRIKGNSFSRKKNAEILICVSLCYLCYRNCLSSIYLFYYFFLLIYFFFSSVKIFTCAFYPTWSLSDYTYVNTKWARYQIVYERDIFLWCSLTISLWKHAYSNIMKILPPKNENFQIKNSDIFHVSAQKHRLWVLVRTASMRQF